MAVWHRNGSRSECIGKSLDLNVYFADLFTIWRTVRAIHVHVNSGRESRVQHFVIRSGIVSQPSSHWRTRASKAASTPTKNSPDTQRPSDHGHFAKKKDQALPGKHTQLLYESLMKKMSTQCKPGAHPRGGSDQCTVHAGEDPKRSGTSCSSVLSGRQCGAE